LGNSLIGRTRDIVSAVTTVLPAELGDAQWMDLLGEAERLENRFQWVNFWCSILQNESGAVSS
jgi:hypothetical protein